MKYMELLNKGVEPIFIDNQTVSTPYIKQLLNVAKVQNLVARTSLESTVKLLLIVELDRAEQERKIAVQRIKDGIEASGKRSGRVTGKLDKTSDELEALNNSLTIAGVSSFIPTYLRIISTCAVRFFKIKEILGAQI